MKPDLDKNVVVAIHENVTRSEQHFYTLQMEYRKLASGWLLAVFAGIGFLLSNNYTLY